MPSPIAVEDLLEGLTEAQRSAVLSEGAPLCVVAAAGAGKTRVLTRRIAHRVATGHAEADHVLALTFTRKAATHLQDRLAALGMRQRVVSGTFHSVAVAQLQRWWADRRQPAPTILDRKSRILGPLASTRPGLANLPVAEMAAHIEWAKARLIHPDDFATAVEVHHRQLPRGTSALELGGLFARYEHEKRRRGLVDFDDLLATCAEAIESDSLFAAAQRWRWRHVFVDEFQDLNPLQHRLLLAWLGSSTDLCVVGDPNQAIYGWNGSDPRLLHDLGERWPSTTVVRLDANHRCSEQIVAAAASVLGRDGDHLTGSGREGPMPGARAWRSEEEEAAGIAAAVVRAHDAGRGWRSMAVLTRTNAQLVPIQRALCAAGVPVHAPSSRAILETPAALGALAAIRRLGRAPIQVVVAELEEMSAPPADPDDVEAAALSEPALDDESRSVITVLAGLARSYASADPGASAARWLAWLPTASEDGSGGLDGADTVTLCSFHRAKGLEWDAVWVAGLEQGLVPIGRAATEDQRSEERRLLYVALTRAESELHCSWARFRTFGGRRVAREPSPWLASIRAAAHGGDSTADADSSSLTSETWRDRLTDQRRALRESARADRGVRRTRLPEGYPTPDPELTSRIKAWRLDTARSSGVPAYLILHDVTIEALASLKPSTSDELLGVPGLGPVKAGRYGPSLLALVGSPAHAD